MTASRLAHPLDLPAVSLADRDRSEDVAVGVIGCGLHSTTAILPSLRHAPIRLVAVCDLDARSCRVGAGSVRRREHRELDGRPAGPRRPRRCDRRRTTRAPRRGGGGGSRSWPSRVRRKASRQHPRRGRADPGGGSESGQAGDGRIHETPRQRLPPRQAGHGGAGLRHRDLGRDDLRPLASVGDPRCI